MKLKKVMLMLCLCSSVFLMSCGKESKDNTKASNKETTTQSDSKDEVVDSNDEVVDSNDEDSVDDRSDDEEKEPAGSDATALDGNPDKVTNYINHPESTSTNKILSLHESGYSGLYYALAVELPDADLSQVVLNDDGVETDTFSLDKYHSDSNIINLRNDPLIIYFETFFDPDATFIKEDGDWKVTEGYDDYYDFVYFISEDKGFEFSYYCETQDKVSEILNLFKNNVHVYEVQEGDWTNGKDSQGNTVDLTGYTYLNDLVTKNFNDHGFRIANANSLSSVEDELFIYHIPYEDSETDTVDVSYELCETPRSSDTFEKTFSCNGVVMMLNYRQDYNYVEGYFVTGDEDFYGAIEVRLPYSVKEDSDMDAYVDQIMKYLF